MRPQWLKISDSIGPCPCCKIKGGKRSFIEKTLAEITIFFKDGLFSEVYANKDGLLQGIDPRVKVLTIVALLVSISFIKYVVLLVALYLIILLLVIFSKIPLRFFIPRVWLFVPLFSGIISIPALFNVFVPGEPLVTIMKFEKGWSIGLLKIPENISITWQGLSTASLFVMRVGSSVSLVVLVVLTTKWPHLLKALRGLGIPHMFTFIISMTYRYINLFLRLIEDMYLAKKSRIITKRTVGEGQRWVASQVGVLLKKSVKMSEDVYSAMLSRGFTNNIKIIDTFRISRVDYLWSGFFIFFIFFVIWLNSIWD